MKYLVDANVLSEPTKPNPDPLVAAWIRAHLREIVVDPVIVGELRFGILKLPHGKKRRSLEDSFDNGIARLNCLPFDRETGLRWAELLADLSTARKSMPIKDSLIAATAIVYGLPVVTRNRADFERAGVKVINPFVD